MSEAWSSDIINAYAETCTEREEYMNNVIETDYPMYVEEEE